MNILMTLLDAESSTGRRHAARIRLVLFVVVLFSQSSHSIPCNGRSTFLLLPADTV